MGSHSECDQREDKDMGTLKKFYATLGSINLDAR